MKKDIVGILDRYITQIIQSFPSNWLYLSDSQAKPKDAVQIAETYQQTLDFESHEYFEICLCMEGQLALEFDDSICQISKGDVCVVFPRLRHREDPRINGSHEAIWCLVNIDTITLMLSGKKEKEDFYVDWACSLPKTAEKFRISEMLKTIRSETNEEQTHSIEYAKAVMLQILIILLRDTDNLVKHGLPKKHWKESIVDDVKAYAETNFAQNFKLDDIAQRLCFSPNYLNTIFKSATGNTITRYAEEIRIQKAGWYLKETDYSICGIASMLGYCDQYHFSKNFKKETGISPTRFRKNKNHADIAGNRKNEADG